MHSYTKSDETGVIDLRDIFYILKKRFWIIILAGIVAGAAGFAITKFGMTPVYQSSAMLIVNKDNSSISPGSQQVTYNDILMTQKLVKTYTIILQSDTVLSKVINSLDLDKTTSELKKAISITGVNETEVLKITVSSHDPEEAAMIANELVVQAPEEIIRTAKVGSVETIDSARVPETPVKPSLPQNMAISVFLGLALTTGIIFLIEYLDNTIKTDEDIKQKYGLPVLGILPAQRS